MVFHIFDNKKTLRKRRVVYTVFPPFYGEELPEEKPTRKNNLVFIIISIVSEPAMSVNKPKDYEASSINENCSLMI